MKTICQTCGGELRFLNFTGGFGKSQRLEIEQCPKCQPRIENLEEDTKELVRRLQKEEHRNQELHYDLWDTEEDLEILRDKVKKEIPKLREILENLKNEVI